MGHPAFSNPTVEPKELACLRHGKIARTYPVRDELELGEIQFQLVDVAVSPVFSRLEGAHDGVFGRMKMFGRVLILGGVAAADVAALQTEAQMDPIVADLHALFAALRSAWSDIADLIEVGTLFHGVSS